MAPAVFGRDAGSTAPGERAHPDGRNKPAISERSRNGMLSVSTERPLRLQRRELNCLHRAGVRASQHGFALDQESRPTSPAINSIEFDCEVI